jgi:APA family basic amino acid/polyamine antiporter
VGEIVGVGIFLTPAGMARGLGSPLLVLLVWLLVGGSTFCGALCYAELAARYPEAGGPYVYLREVWGRGVAFLYGWKSLLVMDPGLAAALAAGLGTYAAVLVPLSPLGQRGVGVLVILGLALLNVLRVETGARVLRALTGLKLGLLALLVVWGFLSGRGSFGHFIPFAARRPGSLPLIPALAGGIVAAFFSFGGFWDVAKLAGELREPSRTLPRAIGGGVAIVTALYILTSGVFLYLVPIEASSGTEAFAARVGAALFGSWAAKVFAAIVVTAVLGSLLAVLMAAPRVYYAMARDGLFLRSVGELHPAFGTPSRAIAIEAVLASLLLALGTFDEIVGYFVFVTLAFVALTVLGLLRLPRPEGGGGAYRVPLYPWTPVVFLSLQAILLALFALGSPREAALGTLVVALGVPVYWIFVRPRGPAR